MRTSAHTAVAAAIRRGRMSEAAETTASCLDAPGRGPPAVSERSAHDLNTCGGPPPGESGRRVSHWACTCSSRNPTLSARRLAVLQDGARAYAREPMDLPSGPRAPAAWQTVAWTTRPAAFLRR